MKFPCQFVHPFWLLSIHILKAGSLGSSIVLSAVSFRFFSCLHFHVPSCHQSIPHGPKNAADQPDWNRPGMPVGLEGLISYSNKQIKPPKKIEQVKEKSPHISNISVGFDFSWLFYPFRGFYLLVLGLCQGLILFHLKQRQFLHGGHETTQWIKLYPPSHRLWLFDCRSKPSIFDTQILVVFRSWLMVTSHLDHLVFVQPMISDVFLVKISWIS